MSFYWDAYKATAAQAIVCELDKLKRHELLALWLQTDAGIDWWYDCDGEQERDPDAPVCVDEIQEYLWERIWGIADSYENARIREYLDSRY